MSTPETTQSQAADATSAGTPRRTRPPRTSTATLWTTPAHGAHTPTRAPRHRRRNRSQPRLRSRRQGPPPGPQAQTLPEAAPATGPAPSAAAGTGPVEDPLCATQRNPPGWAEAEHEALLADLQAMLASVPPGTPPQYPLLFAWIQLARWWDSAGRTTGLHPERIHVPRFPQVPMGGIRPEQHQALRAAFEPQAQGEPQSATPAPRPPRAPAGGARPSTRPETREGPVNRSAPCPQAPRPRAQPY